GTLLYLVDAQGLLQVVDVSDPANPVHLGTGYTEGYIKGLHVKDNKVFAVGEYYDGLLEDCPDDIAFFEIFNVSQPTNPVLVGFKSTPGASGYGVDVANGYAYIVGETPFTVLDLSAGTNWPIIAQYDFPTYGWSEAIQLRGDYAFVAGEFMGLAVVDVSNPADPVRVAQYPMGTGQ